MDVSDRIIVVTGAAGGIGGALVRALVDAGARTVVATDLHDPRELRSETVVTRPLDVADGPATHALVEELTAEIGPIDAWFANAGVSTGIDLDADDAAWDLQWRVNVLSHVHAARALLPGWLERGDGHLVTTASMAGLLSALGDAPYSATKHAAVGYAEWLAFTYRDQGVRVSCVCPGAVDTAMLASGAGGDAAKAGQMIGGGDLLSPEDAAARILEGVREDRLIIYTHPEMQELVAIKAQDPERWLRGMTRLWGKARALLS